MSLDALINETSERIYFTQIQNIILELLEPIEFVIYANLRKIAGEGGKCFYSISNLSKKCKVSENTLRKSLKSLSENHYKEIGNKTFITLQHRKKENGSDDTPIINLTNIWSHNIKYYDEKRSENVDKNLNIPGSKIDLPPVQNLNPPGSEFEPPLVQNLNPNNNHIKNNQLRREVKEVRRQEAPEVDPKKSVVVLSNHLLKLKINESLAKKITKENSEEDIEIFVNRVLSWSGRENDERALLHVIKNKDNWNDRESSETKEEKNKEFLQKLKIYDNKVLGNTNIVVTSNYIEFAAGMKVTIFSISEKNFIQQVTDYIEYLKKINNK